MTQQEENEITIAMFVGAMMIAFGFVIGYLVG